MNTLSDLEEIKKLDKQNVLGSVKELSKQCIHAFEEVSKINVPSEYSDIDSIVMCGMGGSGLGARVIESGYAEKLGVPVVRVNEYHLPGFINNKTLVICSSYSGNTEETLANLDEALAKRAKVMIIGAGGKLIEFAQAKNIPYYKIDPVFNPSNQPRMAIGYSVVGQLCLVAKTGKISLSQDEIASAAKIMEQTDPLIAQELAQAFKEKMIVFVSAEHMVGATHVFNNQLNENSKSLSFDVTIPELNHHLMEGLSNPTLIKDKLLFVFIESKLYSSAIAKRFELTKEIVGKNGIQSKSISLTSDTILNNIFELIQKGAYTSFYTSMLYGIDPAPIPWVDLFKEMLTK